MTVWAAPRAGRREWVPTLVLSGDRDELIPLELTMRLYRDLPNAELAICPQTEHVGPTPDRAAVFASLIRDFALRHTPPEPIRRKQRS